MRSLERVRTSGFTIVELLIVIVVIAILAAITIVAYNGIQARAKLSAYQSEVAGLVKKAEAYNSVKGTYALTANPGTPDTAATVCTASTNATTLTTTLNSVSESALSSGVAICGVLASTGTAPTNAQATTAINTSTSVDYYFVQYCATGKGMRVYYPDPTALGTATASSTAAGVCP